MERLSLPRRNYQASEADTSPSICRPELPKDPLPTWVTLPMDSKLPMIPGPKKKVLLYTTKLGEKRHKSTPELDFDLTDPYSLTMSNSYKSLHDPHLRPHLDTAHMRKRLRRGGFITEDGKVICTLREYNEYRQYLRKINLALNKNRALEGTPSGKRKKVGKDGDADQGHDARVKQIRERLQQQQEREKARYQRLMAEDEKKRRRLREIQSSKMSEKEQQLRQEQDRRLELVRKKQEEDRAQKMDVLRRWLEEDEVRISVTEKRRKERDQERQKKLAESWDERKRIQQQRLSEERRVRHEAELLKEQRLAERERLVQQRRQHQQAIFEKMTKRQREEREKLEAECSKRIADRMARRKTRSKRKRIKKSKHKKMKGRHTLKSNWDVTELLLQEFSEPEDAQRRVGDEGPARETVSDFEVRATELTAEEEEMEIEKKISALGLDDFKGAVFSHEALADTLMGDGNISDSGIPTPRRLTLNMTKLIQKTQSEEVEPEDIAPVLVQINNYLAGKVFYPACRKVIKERAKHKKSIRFCPDVDEHEIYQLEYDSSFSEEELAEEDSDELDFEDELPSDGSRLAIAVDSLTKLRHVSSTEDQSSFAALADILCRLLERLEHGEISPEKACKLAAAARDIFGDSPLISISCSSLSGVSDASFGSNASFVAAELVQTSMNKVQQELLNQYTVDELNEFYGMSPIRATSSELSGMAKFVAETALAMAVESLMKCTDDVIAQQKYGKGKVMSDSELLKKGKRDLPVTRSDSTESVSCPSEFILDILEKVLGEVRTEAASLPSQKPTDESEPMSTTSLYIQELLANAVSSVQDAMAQEPIQLVQVPPQSDTTLFVMDTLQRVVEEIQRNRSPSSTSLFIDDLLCKVTNETTASEPNLSWQETFDVHRRESSASLISIFIRDTLSKVLNEIEKECHTEEPSTTSATSLFAQEIVRATLKKCVSAVHQEMLPGKKLSELTAAIINSQQRNEDRSIELGSSYQLLRGKSQDLDQSESFGEFELLQKSISMTLAENLVKTTLQKARQFLQQGTMSAEQVVQNLNNMSASTGHVAELHIDGEDVPAASCSSEQAMAYVSAAIDKAIQDVSATSLDDTQDTLLPEVFKSATALEVTNFIQSTLANAIRQLCQGLTLTDDPEIEPTVHELQKSLEAVAQQNDEGALLEDYSKDEDVIPRNMTPAEQEDMESENHTQKENSIPSSESVQYIVDSQAPETTDSEEEDEVLLQPFYRGKPVEVDPEVARKALGAISVKNLEEMDDPSQALPRNSFRNLVCPEVSSVTGLDTSSETSTRSQLERASKGTLPSQTRLRVAAASRCTQASGNLEPPPEDDEPVEEKKITKTRSLTLMNKPTSRQGSDTSPYDSPGASPKPSKTNITRAALTGASAPSLRTVSNAARKSPTKSPKVSAKEKSISPMASKKSLTSRTSATSSSPGTSSQGKLSPKKSSGLRVTDNGPSSSSHHSTTSQAKLSPKKSSGLKVNERGALPRSSSHGPSSQVKLSPKKSSGLRVTDGGPSSSNVTSSQSKLSPKKSSGLRVTDSGPSSSNVTSSQSKLSPTKSSGLRVTDSGPSSSNVTSSQSKLSPKKSSGLRVTDSGPSSSNVTSSQSKLSPKKSSGVKLTDSKTSSSFTSSSKAKLSPKKSSGSNVATGASTSSLKRQTSPIKQQSSKTLASPEKKVSSDSVKKQFSTSSVKKTESITSKTSSTSEPVKSQTPEDSQSQSTANIEVTQDQMQPEAKRSQIRDKPLPRESQPIEMTTSHLPPTRRRSSDFTQSLSPKTSNTSNSSSHRTANLAPRPSSGLRKSSSGNLSRSSQHSRTGGSSSSLTATRSVGLVSKTSQEDVNSQANSLAGLKAQSSEREASATSRTQSQDSVKSAGVAKSD